jgi:hypothetical protein
MTASHDLAPLWLLPSLAAAMACTLVVLVVRLLTALAAQASQLSVAVDVPGGSGQHLLAAVLVLAVAATTIPYFDHQPAGAVTWA